MDTSSEPDIDNPELVQWSPRRGAAIGQVPTSFVALASVALAAAAFGALAVGALAVGAVAIGRLAIGRTDLKAVRIGRLVIEDLVTPDRAGRLR